MNTYLNPSLIMAKRIVIIEDDIDIMELLVHIFENEGYHVSSSNISLEAGEIAQLLPDVVLLDINLAGSPKNGDEICLDLRQLSFTKSLPVMLLSAERDLARLAGNCRADGFMEKPFDVDKLIGQVAAIQQ